MFAEYGRSELPLLAGDGGDVVPLVPAPGRDLHQCARGDEPQPLPPEIQVGEVQEPGQSFLCLFMFICYFVIQKNL